MKKSKSANAVVSNKNTPLPIEQISKIRLWLFRFIALIIIPVIFFFLFEITLQIFNFGYSTSALIETTHNDRNYVYENSDFSKQFFPENLAQKFIPLRFKSEKPEDVFRIFILGGSAAQGIPDPSYSFSRILDVMLKHQYPNLKFEILPLAMTAINSHVVLEIAKECIEYDPDLFIVYLGNNEVVGPYGPGTMLTTIVSNHFLLQTIKSFKSTKISQFLTMGLNKLNFYKSSYTKWKGMEMFTQNKIQKNDPRLKTTYRNFNNNLENLNQICEDNNIKIIYNTIVTNLKNSPPFNSAHRSDINKSDLEKWKEFYSMGSKFEESGDFDKAIVEYHKAEKIDNQNADLNYKLGQCFLYTNNFSEAKKHFIQAREYDCNRFRADKRINEIIRNIASQKPGITFLSDALHKIEQLSPNNIMGNEFLFEHVHLNFIGNYHVAKTNLDQFKQIYSKKFRYYKKDDIDPISDSLCADYLAYNDFEHYRISELVLNGFIKQPPFTNQLYHSQTVQNLEAELDSLKKAMQVMDLNLIISNYKDALQKSPKDWLLHNKFADFLATKNISKYQQAAEHYSFVMNSIPHDPDVMVKCGVVLAKLGNLQESIALFQKALSINPTLAKGYFNLGLIYQKMKQVDLSIENYENAINYEPTHVKSYNNLSFIYSQLGSTSKALEILDLGITFIPDNLLLNYNKAMILYKSNRKDEAINYLKHVLELAPKEAKIKKKLNEWLSNRN